MASVCDLCDVTFDFVTSDCLQLSLSTGAMPVNFILEVIPLLPDLSASCQEWWLSQPAIIELPQWGGVAAVGVTVATSIQGQSVTDEQHSTWGLNNQGEAVNHGETVDQWDAVVDLSGRSSTQSWSESHHWELLPLTRSLVSSSQYYSTYRRQTTQVVCDAICMHVYTLCAICIMGCVCGYAAVYVCI